MLKQIHDRFVDENGNVFRKTKTGLVLCKITITKNGYGLVFVGDLKKKVSLHRLIWKAFNGDIPEGLQIDHIDGDKSNNKLNNLRCVSSLENMHNPITHLKRQTEFSMKYYDHFGKYCYEDRKAYAKEYLYFYRHNKCRWEV